jgi:phosphoglycerate dehydrogenase-like enzyme
MNDLESTTRPTAPGAGPHGGAAAGTGTGQARATAPFRVAITGDFERLAMQAAPWSMLGDDAEVIAFPEPFGSAAEAVDALRDFDAVTLMRERIPLTREILEHLPRLKFIVFSGNTNETLDDGAAAERNVIVCNSSPDVETAPGVRGGKPPAELAIALMLACTWQTGRATDLIREGGWAFRPGIPVRGKTLGIIGYGDIGRSVARVALALGMKVTAFSRSLTDEAAAVDNVRRSELDTLLETSDVISIHLRLAPSTRGMVGAEQIARMKDGVILINTARADIVDEQPFLDALRSGKIAMAGLDVFWEEPLPAGHPLTTMPNVVLTPHIGYATEEALALRYRGMLDVLAQYRQGKVVSPYASKPAEQG